MARRPPGEEREAWLEKRTRVWARRNRILNVLMLAAMPNPDGGWLIRGKAWLDGDPEPGTWTIAAKDSAAPPPGKPSVWGIPYAGTPIGYDDLEVSPAE